MMKKIATFDAAIADHALSVLAHFVGRVTGAAERAVAPQLLRTLWLLGHTPQITSADQYTDYAARVAEILRINGAPMSDDELNEFLLSFDGGRAVALSARIDEWERAACGGDQ